MKKVIYNALTWFELEEIIAKYYNIPKFEITDLPNDVSFTYKIDNHLLSIGDQISVKEIIKKGYAEENDIFLILSNLCCRGELEEGNYLLTVSY